MKRLGHIQGHMRTTRLRASGDGMESRFMWPGDAYLDSMRFLPAIPTRGTMVPSSPDWIHEVKHDGFRLLVHRAGDRVRLLTRNGHDWTRRYPWIVEAALKNRTQSLSLMVRRWCLASTACPTLTPCILGSMTSRCSSMPSTCWPWMAKTCAGFP